jgi:hypothetical protein
MQYEDLEKVIAYKSNYFFETVFFIHNFDLLFDSFMEKSKKLCEQYRNRVTGENGLATNMIVLNNSLEFWQQRLELAASQFQQQQDGSNSNSSKSNGITLTATTTSTNTKIKFSDADWQIIYQSIDEWQDLTKKAEIAIGNPLKEIDDLKSNKSYTSSLSAHSNNKAISNNLTHLSDM